MTIYQEYAVVLFIPFAPSAKRSFSTCSKCKAVIQLHYMSPVFKEIHDRLKSDTKAPLWTFTGTAIAIVGLIISAFFWKADEDRIKQMIRSPKKDDIFEITTKSGSYTLFKLKKIERDTVYFYPSKFEIADGTGIDQIYDKGDQGFNKSTTVGIPLSKLIHMSNIGDILDVKRK